MPNKSLALLASLFLFLGGLPTSLAALSPAATGLPTSSASLCHVPAAELATSLAALSPAVAALSPTVAGLLPAQTGSSTAVQERIQAVQDGLLPSVVVKGRAAEMKLAERMEHYQIPGVSIAVINDGRLEWAQGFGVKEAGQTGSVVPATLFQAGSISKPVSAMAALRLVQEGKLDLDADVNDKLKTWKVPDNEFTRAKKVTLRELLSHTAGLTVHGFPGYAPDAPIPSLVEVLNGTRPANTGAIRVDIAPATKWRYSGGGYTVMQQLLVDVTGKPFPELARENVIDRIGLQNSSFEQPPPSRWRSMMATAHSAGKPATGQYHIYPEMAAAGLWTTPSDLARFAIEVQKSLAGTSNKVLSASYTVQMLTPVMNGYALGFSMEGEGDSRRFSHGGVDFGFEALLVAYEKTGQGAVVMTNGTGGSALCQEIVRGIARIYHWPGYPMPKERESAAADVELYRRIAGRYAFGADYIVTVTQEGGKLFATAPGQPKAELIPTVNGAFFTTDDDVELILARDEKGNVTGLVANQGGQKFTLKRLE
jgi:CubicO group peptidase (beta-lactamase class C family)